MKKFNYKGIKKLSTEKEAENVSATKFDGGDDDYSNEKLDETKYMEKMKDLFGIKNDDSSVSSHKTSDVDLTITMEKIRDELNQTDIEHIDICPICIEHHECSVPKESDAVTVNSKYRVFTNRKKKYRELSAFYKVFIKNPVDNKKSTVITVSLRIVASGVEGVCQGTALLMQWSLYVAEGIILSDSELSELLPEKYTFPKVDSMTTTTKQFEGALIYGSTDEHTLNDHVFEYSVTPLTSEVIKGFSDNTTNFSSEPHTITNKSNPQYYEMSHLFE